MKRSKKAQFYIIASIILILIILGMAGVSNYVTVAEEPVKFYELGENLELEGAWIIDYGIYNQKNINETVQKFAEEFSDYLSQTGSDFELVIIYGDQDLSCTQTYSRGVTGEINTGGGNVPIEGVILSDPICTTGSEITIPFSDKEYEVSVKDNENFLFIISSSEGFEDYVYSNI